MTDPNNHGDSTHELPEELCEALAFYDELVENTGNRQQSRHVTLEKYTAWTDRLQQHFDTEDRLLGVAKPDAQATDWAAPPEFFGNTQQSTAHTRFVPRYRLGVGGQGEVWLAHDPELDRFVALKVVKETERGSQQTAARFWREAEMTGKLEHPNIVPVYEAGKTPEGPQTSPYYVMRVFGNRHLLRAITAFHARERQPDDWQLLQALHEYQQRRNAETKDRLQQAWDAFPWDDGQECDRDLKEAIDALRQEAGQQSGRSLQTAIQAYHSGERSNEVFRDLLNRFIDVCNAVAYAHSRGVIHRDLKPQNVMLGEFGETLVVDWGLAKVIGRREKHLAESRDGTVRMTVEESSKSESQTKVGTIVGTPSYMSPEQAWGRVDELTPATDIYSLGGILYAVLTGKPPREGNSHTDIIEKARAGKITAPSVLQADVPKPLEAVCLKALSHATNDRYTTAKELAADVTRWLADEPVSAYSDPLVVRAKRWVKAHQTVVSSTAAAVLVAVVTLSIMMGVVISKNEELETAYGLEEEARILAQQNEAEADRQRAAAVQQSQLALSTLASVIFDVQRGLEYVPGSTEVRRRLLATSLEQLKEVATERVEQAAVDRNTMAALIDMGDVILQFGINANGSDGRDSTSPIPEDRSTEQHSAVAVARTLFERAHVIALERHSNEGETDPSTEIDLCVTKVRLGDVELQTGNTDESLTHYQQALELIERCAQSDPSNTEAQLQLSVVCIRLGRINLRLENAENAQRFFERALEVRQRLAASDPSSRQKQRDVNVALNSLGDLHLQHEDTQRALSYYEAGHTVAEQLYENDPHDAQAAWDLAVSYDRMGDISLRLQRVEDAMEFYQQLLELSERQLGADADTIWAQQGLADACEQLGDLKLRIEGAAEAIRSYQRAFEIRQRLAASDPFSFQAQEDALFSCERLGNAYQVNGRIPEAAEVYGQSLVFAERLASLAPDDLRVQSDLAVSYDRVGKLQNLTEDASSAMDYFQRALAIRVRCAQHDPMNPVFQRNLSLSYENFGKLMLQQDQLLEARKYFQQMHDIKVSLVESDPTDTQALRDLSVSFNNLGDICFYRSESLQALELYQESMAIRQQLAASEPESRQAQRDLSVSYGNIADSYLQLGDAESAMEFHLQSLGICEALAAADPSNVEAQRDVLLTHYKLAEVATAMFEYDIAIDRYTAAIAVLDWMIENDQNADTSLQARTEFAIRISALQRDAAQAEAALADWETFISQPDARFRLSLRMALLARADRFDEIPQSAEMLRSLDVENNNNLYNAACGYALCAGAIQSAEGESLTDHQQTQRQEYIDLAFACLRESIAAGYSDFDHMQQDSDLAVLRDHREFEELMYIPPPPPLVK